MTPFIFRTLKVFVIQAITTLKIVRKLDWEEIYQGSIVTLRLQQNYVKMRPFLFQNFTILRHLPSCLQQQLLHLIGQFLSHPKIGRINLDAQQASGSLSYPRQSQMLSRLNAILIYLYTNRKMNCKVISRLILVSTDLKSLFN